MKRLLLVSVVSIAACKKSGGESAKPFVDATGDVASTASLAATQLEGLDLSNGPEGFVDAITTLIQLRGLALEQKKVTASGDLGDCAERWYGSSEAYVAAITPLVEQAAQGGDDSLSKLFELKAVWGQQEAAVTKSLCDLVADAKACLPALSKAKAGATSFQLLATGHAALCP